MPSETTLIEKYPAMDLETWDYSGNGVNVRRLLEREDPVFWRLFEIARPTNDVRGDPGHMENVVRNVYYLSKLMGGDLHLVIPFAEFHDSSWNITAEQYKQMLAEGRAEDPKNRFAHQANGALKALDAFKQVDYPEKYWLPVFSFIVDHDTRYREPISINEMICRDADILWRFSEPSRRIYHKGLSPIDFVLKLEHDELARSRRFYLPVSEQIAKLEMINAAMQINRNEAIRTLRDKYTYEVDRMIRFYVR
jgi:hypothetical protein